MFGYMKKVTKQTTTALKVGDNVTFEFSSSIIAGKIKFISHRSFITTMFIETLNSMLVAEFAAKIEGMQLCNLTEYFDNEVANSVKPIKINMTKDGHNINNLEYYEKQTTNEINPLIVGDVIKNYKFEEWTVTFIPNDNTLVLERDGQVRLLTATDKSQLDSFKGLMHA
jgi:hypothetical protein